VASIRTDIGSMRQRAAREPESADAHAVLVQALANSGRMCEAWGATLVGLAQCAGDAALLGWRDDLRRQIPQVTLPAGDRWSEAVAQLRIDLQREGEALDVSSAINRARSACGLEDLPRLEALEQALGPDASAWRSTFASMVDSAARLPELLPHGLPVLAQGRSDTLQLTRAQIRALLAAGMLGVFPSQDWRDLAMPDFDFGHILVEELAKCACMLQYFLGTLAQEADLHGEVVDFQRNLVLEDSPQATVSFWQNSAIKLAEVSILDEGGIEDAAGALQADFANEYIGGGVFFSGCVQEEIRFAVSPELLVACLLCEVMAPNEAVVIAGAQQFSRYAGYGHSFEYAGPWEDASALDGRRRRDVHVVAFDALMCVGDFQYQAEGMLRELVKAMAAFQGDQHDLPPRRRLATGNWGSGVFAGDPQLKFLLQWMACSVSGRDMDYFPFRDPRMCELRAAVLKWSGSTVGDVWKRILQVHATQPRKRDASKWKYHRP